MAVSGQQNAAVVAAATTSGGEPCPACGGANVRGLILCGHCAALLVSLFCPLCGGRSEPGCRFCPTCGASFVPAMLVAALAGLSTHPPTAMLPSPTVARAPTVAWPPAPHGAALPVPPLAVGAPAPRGRRRVPAGPLALGLAFGVLTCFSLVLSLVLPPVGLAIGRAGRLFGLTGRRVGALCYVAAMLGVCCYLALLVLAPDTLTSALAGRAGAIGAPGGASGPLGVIVQTFQNVDAIVKQVAAALQGAH